MLKRKASLSEPSKTQEPTSTQGSLLTPASAAELSAVLEKVKRLRTLPDEWEKIRDYYLLSRPKELDLEARET